MLIGATTVLFQGTLKKDLLHKFKSILLNREIPHCEAINIWTPLIF